MKPVVKKIYSRLLNFLLFLLGILIEAAWALLLLPQIIGEIGRDVKEVVISSWGEQ